MSGKIEDIAESTTDPEEREFKLFQLAKEIAGSDPTNVARVQSLFQRIADVKAATDTDEQTKEFLVYKLMKEIAA